MDNILGKHLPTADEGSFKRLQMSSNDLRILEFRDIRLLCSTFGVIWKLRRLKRLCVIGCHFAWESKMPPVVADEYSLPVKELELSGFADCHVAPALACLLKSAYGLEKLRIDQSVLMAGVFGGLKNPSCAPRGMKLPIFQALKSLQVVIRTHDPKDSHTLNMSLNDLLDLVGGCPQLSHLEFQFHPDTFWDPIFSSLPSGLVVYHGPLPNATSLANTWQERSKKVGHGSGGYVKSGWPQFTARFYESLAPSLDQADVLASCTRLRDLQINRPIGVKDLMRSLSRLPHMDMESLRCPLRGWNDEILLLSAICRKLHTLELSFEEWDKKVCMKLPLRYSC